MYLPPLFREDRTDVLHAAIRAHPLATLITQGSSGGSAAGLTANLLPFLLVEREGRMMLHAHLARANPQIEDLRAGGEALVVFQGPEAYVTPAWYPAKHEHGKVVPTWNYVMVQVRGTPRVIDEPGWLLALVSALTDEHEKNRPAPWAVTDAPEDFVAGMLKGIVGLEIPIERIEGKWKASQNQPQANRAGVIAGLREDDPTSPMAAIVEERHGSR